MAALSIAPGAPASARVIPLPGAAAAPVFNARRRGRYPRGVTPIWHARVRRLDVAVERAAAQAAHAKAWRRFDLVECVARMQLDELRQAEQALWLAEQRLDQLGADQSRSTTTATTRQGAAHV